jgi:hypothetical protein
MLLQKFDQAFHIIVVYICHNFVRIVKCIIICMKKAWFLKTSIAWARGNFYAMMPFLLFFQLSFPKKCPKCALSASDYRLEHQIER